VLEHRSYAAVDEAYHAALQAEEATSTFSRQAAVAAAQSTQYEHDAVRQSRKAIAAADVSGPYTAVEKVRATWEQLKGGSQNAIDAIKTGALAALDHVKHWRAEASLRAHVIGQRCRDAFDAAQQRFAGRQ
jgi:hypothetical protein